jgi:TonB-linked SusC/RagA family outer membrane protein
MNLWALISRTMRNCKRIFLCNPVTAVWLQSFQGLLSFKRLFQPKIINVFLVIFLMTFTTNLYSQGVTINKTNVPLQTVFSEIEKQSRYQFFYNESLLQKASNVTIDVKDASIEEALSSCFKNQPLTYALVDNTIIVKRKEVAEVASVNSSSETNPINGKVTGSNGEPVAGATVSVKGTDIAIATDEKGNFVLNDVNINAVLVVSSVAHMPQEIKIGKRTSFAISLKEKVNDLDAALVVAYNTTTQRSNVGAVTVVKGEQIQDIPNRSFDKSLQGLVPGLLITQGTGAPGGGVSNFVLRGISTAADLSSTVGSARNPLIVVDGVPVSQDHFQLYKDNVPTSISNPLAQLNPSDIETLTVLKDAAAIALYGARASNGVIVITTKRGKSGRTVFSLRHQTDIASRLKGNVEVLNQQEYFDLLIEGYKNFDPVKYPTDASVYNALKTLFPTRADGHFYPESDWSDAIFHNQAVTVSNELSMSGGNDRSNFYLNLEYTNQNGIVRKSGYDRKSLRFNFENRPTSWLKLGLNATMSYNVQDYGGSTRGYNGPVVPLMSPLNPVRYEDGSLVLNFKAGGGPQNPNEFSNPVAQAEYNINRNTSYRGLSKIYGEINFLKNFKFISNAGFDFMLGEAKEKADPRLFDIGAVVGFEKIGRIEEQDSRSANLISTNILRYDKIFGKNHALNILAGQEAQVITQKLLLLSVRNLALPYYDQINSPGVTVYKQDGYKTKETFLSFFGQANYSFRSKYFVSSSIRRDGSSRFGEEKRYGTYWSTGAGWVISAEPFMKGINRWMDYLKIRGSMGAAGNAASINRFSRFDALSNGMFLGGTAVFPQATPGNPEVKWENTFSWDAGLEMRFMKERIRLTADIYEKKTSDLIYRLQLPLNSGYLTVPINIGEMENKGIEMSFSGDIFRSKVFRLNLFANWSANQNKLVKTTSSNVFTASNLISNKAGENFNSFYLKKWAGVDPATGKAQWIDSTGKPNSVFNASKKEFVGKPQPDGFGSFGTTLAYRSFELGAMFYYMYGYQVYASDDLINDGAYPYENQDKRALDRWRKAGDIAMNPQRILNNSNNAGTLSPSTRYLFDGDYIRLQNVSLSYNFSPATIQKLHLTRLRVYVQGNNLYIWTKYPGYDPGNSDIGGAVGLTYPLQRTFSLGLNANF